MDCEEESKVVGTDSGSVQHLDGGVLSSLPTNNVQGEESDSGVDPVLSDRSELIVNNGNSKSQYQGGMERYSEERLSRVQRVMRNDCDSDLSTFSEANSEISEREITLDPCSADESASLTETGALSAGTPENEQTREIMLTEEASTTSEAAIGASEEREDISDEELELDSLGNMEHTEPQVQAALCDSEQTVSAQILNDLHKGSEVVQTSLPQTHFDAMSYNDSNKSSNERKYNDLQSAAGICESGDQNDDPCMQVKDTNEDLETVSDDELPEAAQSTVSAAAPVTFSIVEGGEDVSSSEDEGPAVTNALLQLEISMLDKVSNSHSNDASQFPYGNINSSDLTLKTDAISSSHLSLDPSVAVPLTRFEAEPISDEEDLGHTEASVVDVEGGEAGEIQSPVMSPGLVPEQGTADLLGEVEPISADESSDTDGELHSADEDTTPKGGNEAAVNPSNSFLESIDSEEEGDLGVGTYRKHLQPDNRHSPVNSSVPAYKRNDGEYMETISDDDENMCVLGNARKLSSAHENSMKQMEEMHAGANPAIRDMESEKRQITTNFGEHQEELDYEENEGDEGEGKAEESVSGHEKKEAREAGELIEAPNSDKDEGELSDDDCEEGEIKEPGVKKPFFKPMCRFFQKGSCTWGVNCRFLHPGINDKGNYQMIEIPGFKPVGVRSRIGNPGSWPVKPEDQVELPPPPMPDLPPVETAWERGLRIAKEQRKKASERKELEADFEDKRLNLSVDEERELNKENERMLKVIPKDPYYQYEEDEYYGVPRDPWPTSRYENFEVRYRENSSSPPYREKPPILPPARFPHPYSSPAEKFERDRTERREPFRPEPLPHPHPLEYPSALKRPDEWTDPWRRSKSPQNQKHRIRSRSRGRRTRRSVSDSSNSSRSSSGSSSGSSRSSRSFNSSTGSSSRSRSPEQVAPGVDRHERYISPSRDQPRSAVSVRGPGGYNNYDQNYRRGGRGYDQNHGTNTYNQRGGYRGGGGGPGFYNNYFNSNVGAAPVGGGYPERDMRDRNREDRIGRVRARSPPDRPLPYVRPRPKSASSRSSSSRSHSRSRGRATSSRSRSRSSTGSSRSSSSSSSSAGSADSEHLYRDLGSPSKNPRAAAGQKRKRTNSYRDHAQGKGPQVPGQQVPQRRSGMPAQMPINLDHIPHPRDPKPPLPVPPPGRPESKYASRNVPQAPVKAKDPLKVVGQKSNIKLTLLPKQQQSSLGSRPNPLDSPPHKRRLSDRDASPIPLPPSKRVNLPVPQSAALRIAIEKAAKIQIRQEKGKSPPPPSLPQSLPASSSSSSSSVLRAKAPVSPQKPSNSIKLRAPEPVLAKTVPKIPAANAPTATATGTKAKKSMSSRREELLKQLKAVEDAIARKKSKLQ